MRYFRHNIFVLLIAALVIGGSLSAYGQNTKAKPKPLATPLPTLSGAEIISRAAEDYVEPSAAEKAAEKGKETQPEKKPASTTAGKINDLNDRVKKLETAKAASDEKQKRLLLNLDILTRAEARVETLRKQVFDMVEKESALKVRLEQVEMDMRPEAIERTLQIAGSLRPEEVRDARRKSLTAERNNIQTLMTQVQTTRTSLELALRNAEQLVERIRAKLEKDIDKALTDDDDPDQ